MILHSKPNLDKLDKLQKSTKILIKEKIDSGNYTLIDNPCFCDNEENYVVVTNTFFPNFSDLDIKVVMCKKCGTVRTSPYFDNDSLADFYMNHYRNLYEGKKKFKSNTLFKCSLGSIKKVVTGKSTYEFLKPFTKNLKKKYNKKQLKIFEIGCGYGGNLYKFYKDGEDVYGCDYGNEGLKIAQNKGMKNTFKGDSSTLAPYGIPDIVIINHVLEHIVDLKLFFSNLKKIISTDTIVFIGVPSLNSISWQYNYRLFNYFHIAHVWHFTNNTLDALMAKEGFEKIESNEIIQATYKYTGKISKVSLLSEYSKNKVMLQIFEDANIKQNKKAKRYKLCKILLLILLILLCLTAVHHYIFL